jgi:hypothetical protein
MPCGSALRGSRRFATSHASAPWQHPISQETIHMIRYKKQNLFHIIAELEAKKNPTYTKFVEDYRVLSKKCAENFIRRAETVHLAKENLDPDVFSAFCREVGLDEKGATCRKWLRVGSVAGRFEPFLDRMPDCWTTIYKLACLEKDQFDRVAHDSRFSPTITALEIDRIVGKTPKVIGLIGETPKAGGGKRAHVVTIDFSGLKNESKADVYRALVDRVIELADQFGLALEDQGNRLLLVDNQLRRAA